MLMDYTTLRVQTVSETKTAVGHHIMAAFVLANAHTQVFAVVTSTSTSIQHKSISINKQ